MQLKTATYIGQMQTEASLTEGHAECRRPAHGRAHHVGVQILLQYDVTRRFRFRSANTEELDVCGSHHVHRGPQEAGRIISWGSRGHCMGEGNLIFELI